MYLVLIPSPISESKIIILYSIINIIKLSLKSRVSGTKKFALVMGI